MDNSSSYPDLIQSGLRKKKKKIARGEITTYDPDKGRRAEDSAAGVLEKAMKKKTGVKWGK